MHRIALLVSAAALLAGCAAPVPAVSQFNGDSVSVQVSDAITYYPKTEQDRIYSEMQAQADDICVRGHRKRAEYTSQRTIPTGTYTSIIERLYLCLN